MTHYMNLHPGPFEMIKSKIKTVEMRLNDEKRKLIKINDLIIFTNNVTFEELVVKVIDIKSYKNFSLLYKEYSKEKIGYKEEETVNPDDMLKYYSEEKILKYGVLAVRIEVIE